MGPNGTDRFEYSCESRKNATRCSIRCPYLDEELVELAAHAFFVLACFVVMHITQEMALEQRVGEEEVVEEAAGEEEVVAGVEEVVVGEAVVAGEEAVVVVEAG